jgi:hypothetical protein
MTLLFAVLLHREEEHDHHGQWRGTPAAEASAAAVQLDDPLALLLT